MVTPLRPSDARWDLVLWHLNPDARKGLEDWVAGDPVCSAIAGLPGVPDSWSDQLFLETQSDMIREFADLGLMQSAYPAAVLQAGGDPDAVTLGRTDRDERYMSLTGIPSHLSNACRDIVAARSGPPMPLLSRMTPAYWKSAKTGFLRDFVLRLRAELARAPVTDLIILPGLGVGGAERVGYWHYRLLSEKLGRHPLILLADHGQIEDKYKDMRILPLLTGEEVEGPFVADRGADLLVQGLITALREVAPDTVHVVQSYPGFEWLQAVAAGTAPRPDAKLIASFFCAHTHADGVVDGYHLAIPYLESALDSYVSDNRYFADELRRLHSVPDAACMALDYPANQIAAIAPETPLDARRGRVLWAGRFDHQKQPEIVPRIAQLLPDVDFHMYGGSVLGDSDFAGEIDGDSDREDPDDLPDNVTLHGPFSNFFDLPLAQADLFLNTALFEGVPQILAEAGSVGLPVVASAVGGVPEIVTDQTGRLVADPQDPTAYATAIRALLDPAENARARAATLARMQDTRSFEAFCQAGADWFDEILNS